MSTIDEANQNIIYAFGINHQSANVAVREKFAFSPEDITQALQHYQAQHQGELALLSTCNRTELYLVSDNPPDMLAWLVAQKKVSPESLAPYFFMHEGRQAVRHINRVACGLDSLILGEPQILGQMKQAYHLAKQAGSVHSILDRLFQQSFSVAKKVRHSTTIGQNPVSVAYAGIKLTQQFFNDHPERTALVIGAGETATLAVKYLRDLGIGRLIIANRTLEKAQQLATQHQAYALPLEQIASHLHEADIIVGAARSEYPLVYGKMVQSALKQRRQAMQVYIDLSIPRLFDGDIDELDDAFLYSIDHLEQIIEDNVQSRKIAAQKAEVIVNLHSDDFLGWLRSRPQQRMVRKMRDQAHEIRQQLLADAYRRLAHGEDPAKLLEQLALKLTNKLLHSPSELIQAIPPDHKDWLAIVADTFDSRDSA
ncbi:MAG: glutamyl-tRNA reductase [Cardiobacteriaceae bacterium]|nr:glutamyl-tRNA reductase [Cardiobacteriaceae bacterium]